MPYIDFLLFLILFSPLVGSLSVTNVCLLLSCSLFPLLLLWVVVLMSQLSGVVPLVGSLGLNSTCLYLFYLFPLVKSWGCIEVRASPSLTYVLSPLLVSVFLFVPQSNLHLSSLIPGVRDAEWIACKTDTLVQIYHRTLTESGTFALSESIVSILVTGKSKVLGLFIFVGLYLALLDHLTLILPGALFLRLVCVLCVTG